MILSILRLGLLAFQLGRFFHSGMGEYPLQTLSALIPGFQALNRRLWVSSDLFDP